MLLSAGWLRVNCSEPISATCPGCGSPIDLTSGDLSNPEKECWVCMTRGTPIYQCSRCSQTLDQAVESAERICHSVLAFENGCGAAFQPECSVWFHEDDSSGKTVIGPEEDLRQKLRSGELKPDTLVCENGGAGFVKALEHPVFTDLLAHHRVTREAETPETVTPPPLPPPETTEIPRRRRHRRPSGSGKNSFKAVVLGAVFGPLGLLYISWKASLAVFVLHFLFCALIDWHGPTAFMLWHFTPAIVAAWMTRGTSNFAEWLRLFVSDFHSTRSEIVSFFNSVSPLLISILLSKKGNYGVLAIFLCGFLYASSYAMIEWAKQSNWIAVILIGALFICSAVISKQTAQKYAAYLNSGALEYLPFPFLPDTDSLAKWLRWSAFALLLFVTYQTWDHTIGTGRLILLAATIAIPWIPFLRGAVGAFALGCLSGLIALLGAGIVGGILGFLYSLIMN